MALTPGGQGRKADRPFFFFRRSSRVLVIGNLSNAVILIEMLKTRRGNRQGWDSRACRRSSDKLTFGTICLIGNHCPSVVPN